MKNRIELTLNKYLYLVDKYEDDYLRVLAIFGNNTDAAKAAIKKAIGKKGIDAIKKMMGR